MPNELNRFFLVEEYSLGSHVLEYLREPRCRMWIRPTTGSKNFFDVDVLEWIDPKPPGPTPECCEMFARAIHFYELFLKENPK